MTPALLQTGYGLARHRQVEGVAPSVLDRLELAGGVQGLPHLRQGLGLGADRLAGT